MSFITKAVKTCANVALSPLGYEVRWKPADEYVVNGRLEVPELPGVDGKDEGFADYLRQANGAGMDLNDWLEHKAGWGGCLQYLEKTTIPLVRPSSLILEVGPGSGRFSRHLVKHLTGGKLFLIDNSPWKVEFLRRYFRHDYRVEVYLNDGYSIHWDDEGLVDLCCSFGTFIYLKLGQIYNYAREFFRVLKPGGHVVFDYLDMDTEPGQYWLDTHSDREFAGCFTYYTRPVLDRVFTALGFEVVPLKDRFDDYNYVIYRKPLPQPA